LELKGLIPAKIISVNQMYLNVKRRVVLSKEARKFKDEVFSVLDNKYYEDESIQKTYEKFREKVLDQGKPLTMEIIFLMNSRYWNRDLDNAVKITQDIISEFYEFDDALITDLKVSKRMIDDDTEYIYYRIYPTKILSEDDLKFKL
jgi:Holliday junction resolvase RusA-like endonuclease